MNELVKINSLGYGGVPTVSGRELHEALKIETRYNDWFARMCEYGFVEGEDFYSFLSKSTGGRPSIDHALTIDTAKEICMIQRTEIGRTIRRYFIETEKKYRQQTMTLNTSYLPEETPFGLPIREYNGQRVLTFKDIADVHQRKAPAIRKDFRYNCKYFTEGKDFFFVKLEDVKKYKIQISGITVPVKGITLFTLSGYLVLVKSFKDYLSRDVQQQLTKNYFKVPEQVQTAETISLQEDKLLMFNQRLTELEDRMNTLERKTDFKELINLLYHTFQEMSTGKEENL